MHFAHSLILLLSLAALTVTHPLGDLSYRHHRQRRSEEEELGNQATTSAKTGKECFFAKKRISKYENPKLSRPTYSQVSENCGGNMKRISELLDVSLNNLYQCPNYPALILFRGAGIFEIDWTNKDEVEEIGKKWICDVHEAELGRNWHSAKPRRHYKDKARKQDPHKNTVCAEHNEEARRILAQEKVESRGYNIRPSPVNGDFSQASVISRGHCAKEFLSEKNLEKHLTINKHLRRPEVENVLDYALHQFSSFLEAVFPPQVCPVVDGALNSLASDNANGVIKKMGWALPKRQRSKPFPKSVKTFLRSIYDEGARTRAKIDPKEAEEMMRLAIKPGGGMLFAIDDLLTSRHIAGVYAGFKRTTLEKRGKVGKRTQKKKMMNEDVSKGEPMEVDDVELDEVNDLFATEGDPELEYDTEPLFDEEEAMRRAILAKHGEIFDDADDDVEAMET